MIIKLKLNLWLTAPKEATHTPATDWQITVRRDNVISIMLRQVYFMSTFLIRPATSQSSSYAVVLTRLGGSRLSRNNPHVEL